MVCTLSWFFFNFATWLLGSSHISNRENSKPRFWFLPKWFRFRFLPKLSFPENLFSAKNVVENLARSKLFIQTLSNNRNVFQKSHLLFPKFSTRFFDMSCITLNETFLFIVRNFTVINHQSWLTVEIIKLTLPIWLNFEDAFHLYIKKYRFNSNKKIFSLKPQSNTLVSNTLWECYGVTIYKNHSKR